ncbi:hypothetical protein ACW6QP_10835 [Salegentibacter sp. HM20]
MDISIFLAKFWGWYLLIFFFILSFNPKRIRQIFEDLRDQKFLILVAFMAIILGLLNVLFHNVWELNWRLLITGLGWLALLMGIGLFVFPDSVTSRLEIIEIKLVQTIYVFLI